ncbi:MAG: hypothetical protein COB69_06510 [Phycisphaera sp.]|nr:MAG: hypothetical protein COB69_06510 [Phycisphaera sp.]
MTLTPFDFLALPGIATAATRSIGRALDSLIPGSSGFADKLSTAQSKQDQLPVEMSKGLDLDLTKEQLGRIADAVDRAEAEGADAAVVMIDGMALEVDVTMRTIRGQIDQDGGINTQIDSIVYAKPASSSSNVVGPDGLASNPDVRQIIADTKAA